MAAFDGIIGHPQERAFCRFGGEVSFRLKIRGGHNTPCIADFPKYVAGAKDLSKARTGWFAAVANCIEGEPPNPKNRTIAPIYLFLNVQL